MSILASIKYAPQRNMNEYVMGKHLIFQSFKNKRNVNQSKILVSILWSDSDLKWRSNIFQFYQDSRIECISGDAQNACSHRRNS